MSAQKTNRNTQISDIRARAIALGRAERSPLPASVQQRVTTLMAPRPEHRGLLRLAA